MKDSNSVPLIFECTYLQTVLTKYVLLFREVSVQICDEPDIVTKGDTNSSDDNDEEDEKEGSAE